jgi:hypothetical protein
MTDNIIALKDRTEWRIIGEFCVDSGSLVIVDPCRADKVVDWGQTYCDLGNDRRHSQLTGHSTWGTDTPIAVATHTYMGRSVCG